MRNKLVLSLAALAIGAVSQADIVLNQLDFNQANQFNTAASQDFEAAQNPFDVIAVDDFTVTALQTNITNVEAIMNGWSGFDVTKYTNGAVTGYRVEFYSSLAAAGSSMTGDAGSTFVAAGSATVNVLGWASPFNNSAHVVLPINVVLPGAGTYWVGVAAVMNFTPHGQLGVNATNAVLGNQNGNMANASGGWGWSGNVFGGIPDNTGAPVAKDLEYLVEATAVPEPGSMIALGLGAAALAARRRRKAA